MAEINHHLRTIKESLSIIYKVPYYQREYRWKRRQFEELLNDLQEEFTNQFDPSHGRERIAQYKTYFLGTILTTTDEETARKIIIDGQQRLTSLTLFFIYAIRQRNAFSERNITNFESLIRRESYGDSVLNFEVDAERKELVDKLLEEETIEGNDSFDFIDDADTSTKNAFLRFKDIEDILDDGIKDEYFAYFADWIAEKVVIFEIVVPTEHDAHKVFVTMNDRGLNLTPSEMLKGFLLSHVTNSQKHVEAHTLWADKVRELKKIDGEEDSNFLRTWLRAKYARDIRGRAQGETKKDFENIGDSYHRWLHENKELVGLENDDDYQSFILDNFKKYVDIYLRIEKYSNEYTNDYEYIYYNATKDITLQNMLILSAIKLDDSDSIVDKKIKLVSRYIDYFTTVRTFELKKNTYDNLRDIFFSLTKDIRDKSEEEIKQVFLRHSSEMNLNLEKFVYGKAQTKTILHILARISAYLEREIDLTNSVGYSTYIDRKRSSRTFDIEHIFAEDYQVFEESVDDVDNDFESSAEFKTSRDKLGGLILLPRSRNRSLQDKPYSDKVAKYASECILAQLLNSDFYENNPQLERFLESSGLDLKAYDVFNKNALNERHTLYENIIAKIWSISEITT